MANYSTTANVVLSVNGRQAQKMLSSLEKDAKRLEKQIERAALAGDKATMKRLQRELNQTKKTVDQLRGAAASVDEVLKRLDKATPKELNRALKTLQQQLNGIQRGTKAWDDQVAKIKAVRTELNRVNASMGANKSMSQKLIDIFNKWQVAIMGTVAALTGLIMAGRKSVQSYADMEESLANTQKYTRMTAQEVELLNNLFKKTDTRLTREQLNLLAQEAGRLGYNTVDKVKQYVDAASVINVALVDLGEGATQTIAKISNIFGIEEEYGTRDAMLKLGSTVNHLSQNCTAAKPFIVEFTQRMAGIGSTAKMAVPDIMAFAATLDANGQKVEMSATAIQRVIMELFKAPGEMARKVGLNANYFTKVLLDDTTKGLTMFLEKLGEIGESKALAVLAPLFEDLGLDGARVSQVLANLGSHIDFLKWQLGEARTAFKEGTSAVNEYTIFNNTAQASIDKAKNRVKELAIELGEKLFPVMRHIYTSSSVFLRVLNEIVSFIIEHARAIISLTAAVVAYTLALNASTIATNIHYAALVLVEKAQLAWNSVLKAGTAIQVAHRIAVVAYTKVSLAAQAATVLFTKAVAMARVGMVLMSRAIVAANATFVAMVKGMALVRVAFVALFRGIAQVRVAFVALTQGFIAFRVALVSLGRSLATARLAMATFSRSAATSRLAFATFARGIAGAGTAFKLLGRAIATTPIGLVATAVATATAAFFYFRKGSDQAAEAQKRIAEQSAKTSREIANENDKIDMLFSRLNAAEKGSLQYQKAKDEIISKYGKYLKGLGDEVEALNNVALAYRTIKEEAENAAKARGLEAANQAAEDAFNGVLESEGKGIISALRTAKRKVRRGNGSAEESLSSTEQARWAQRIIEEASHTESDFSPEVMQFLKSIGTYRDKGGNWRGGDLADALNKIVEASVTRATEKFENGIVFGSPANNYEGMTAEQVERHIYHLEEILQSNYQNNKQGYYAALPNGNKVNLGNNNDIANEISQLRTLLTKLQNEDEGVVVTAKSKQDPFEPYVSQKEIDKQQKEADKALKEALDKVKGRFESRTAELETNYTAGLVSWSEYIKKKYYIELDYYNDRQQVYKRMNRQEDEDYKELLKNKAMYLKQHQAEVNSQKVDDIRNAGDSWQARDERWFYTPGTDLYQNQEALNIRMFESRVRMLKLMQQIYNKGSKEWIEYQEKIDKEESNEKLRRQKLLYERIQEWRKKYEYLSAGVRYNQELALLEEAKRLQLIKEEEYEQAKKDLREKYQKNNLPDSAKPDENNQAKRDKQERLDIQQVESLYKQGLLSEVEYQKALKRIRNKYRKDEFDLARSFGSEQTNQLLDIYQAWKDFFDDTAEYGENWAGKLGKLAGAVFAVMNAGMQQYSEYMQACTDLEIAKTEKKYDREIELAEGNSYKTQNAEKKKEKEIARIKSEASKKQYSMQVIQAVAQTATNALNAYGSAQNLPFPASQIVGALAASIATAQGLAQIAIIKKQQQASEAQGYSSGGFTPSGAVDDVAGVVHKGEWVASQRLVNNPRVRPLLEALDYAQRTNTIGSITAADVSGSVTAPAVMAAIRDVTPVVGKSESTVQSSVDPQLTEVIRALSQRLKEPFVTVNTVTGDYGSKRAQEEYDKLIRNKSPKYR